jgi:hypothetical protein
MHQAEQRKGGLAQPAKAIVPISDPIDKLGQRGSGSGDDPVVA